VQFYGGDTVMLRLSVVLSVLAIGTGAVSAAERPPQLNLEPTCSVTALGVSGRTRDACMNSEHAARDTLGDTWKDFNAKQHKRCTDLIHMGGPPSYVELLTCLEMAKQAQAIPDRDLLKGPLGMNKMD
jgi:hypothetical protein